LIDVSRWPEWDSKSSSQDTKLDRRLGSWPVRSIAVIYDTWLGLTDASAIAGDTLFRGKPVNRKRLLPAVLLRRTLFAMMG